MTAGSHDLPSAAPIVHEPFAVRYRSRNGLHCLLTKVQCLTGRSEISFTVVIYLYTKHVKCRTFCFYKTERTASAWKQDPVTVHRETVHQTDFLDESLALQLVQISWTFGLEIQIYQIVLFVPHRIIQHEHILSGYCDEHGR